MTLWGDVHLVRASGCSDAIIAYVKDRAQIQPRLLNKEQAAAYCGVGTSTFEAICPVRVIQLGSGVRLHRYDIVSLDKWIDGLSGGETVTADDWLAKMDETDGDDGSGQRN
jgi:hypothetical protein